MPDEGQHSHRTHGKHQKIAQSELEGCGADEFTERRHGSYILRREWYGGEAR